MDDVQDERAARERAILESGFAAEIARQLQAAADAAVQGAQAAGAGGRRRLWLVVACLAAVIVIVVAVVVAPWRSSTSGGGRVAATSPSPSPVSSSASQGGVFVVPPRIERVTTIETMGLDAGGRLWVSGRLGEQEQGFAAYLSDETWRRLSAPEDIANPAVVAAISPSDVWAAVRRGVAHWDGSSWSAMAVPWLDGDVAWLHAMAASASDDVWGVGHRAGRIYRDPDGTRTVGWLAATMHWNGSRWSTVSVPTEPGRSSALEDVASHGGESWAVGWYERKVGVVKQRGGAPSLDVLRDGPVALRWDGGRWVEMEPPNAGEGGTRLLAALVIGPGDVWVLGSTARSDDPRRAEPGRAYLAHWDGKRWQQLATPRASRLGSFAGLGGVADDDLWLAGSGRGGEGYPETAHWDGRHWTLYGPATFTAGSATSSRPAGEVGANDPTIVAASSTDVWFDAGFSVFWDSSSSVGQGQVRVSASDPMLFHWDGRSWDRVKLGF